MNNDRPVSSLTVDTLPGARISEVCKRACLLALQLHIKVVFVFNGERMCAYPYSDPAKLVKQSYERFEANRSEDL